MAPKIAFFAKCSTSQFCRSTFMTSICRLASRPLSLNIVLSALLTFFALQTAESAVGMSFKRGYSETLLRMMAPGTGFCDDTLYDVTLLMKIMSKSI